MSLQLPSISGDITLTSAGATTAMRVTVAESKNMKVGVEKNLKDAAATGEKSFKGMLSNIKGDLGKNSAIGQSIKLLAGGGAIAGANMAANQFKAMTADILEMSNAFRSGKMDAGEFAEKIAGSVPLFGPFFEAGRNIREMFTGEKAALKATEDQMAAFDAAIAYHKKTVEQITTTNIAYNDTLRTMRQEFEAIGVSGVNRELLDIRQQTENLIATANKGTGMNALTDEEKNKWRDFHQQIKDLGPKPQLDARQQFIDPTKGAGDQPIGAAFHQSMEDDRIQKQRQALVDWTLAIDTIKPQIQGLQDIMDNAGKNATGLTFGANLLGFAKTGDVFKQKWISATHEWSEASVRDAAKVKESLRGLETQVSQFGMTDSQKKMDDFKKMPGVTPAEIASQKKLLDQVDRQDRGKTESEKMSSFKESVELPMDKFSKTVAELNLWRAGGVIDQGQFQRGIANAHKEDFGPDEYRAPGLYRAGSAEAQAAKYDGGNQKADGVKDATLEVRDATVEVKSAINDLGTIFTSWSQPQPASL